VAQPVVQLAQLPESPAAPAGNPSGDQRWSTFLKNHADAIIACDFCVVATATFRVLYVLVVMEHVSRRIIHLNVTAHPTAAWTLQQLREAIPSDHTYRFILHDRDAIFSTGFDASVARMGLEVITTPVRSPKANSLCERLIGTLPARVSGLDNPLDRAASSKNSVVLAGALQSRPTTLLFGARPARSTPESHRAVQRQRHRFEQSSRVVAHSVLNGLHHEYCLLASVA
jgi:putative transposase